MDNNGKINGFCDTVELNSNMQALVTGLWDNDKRWKILFPCIHALSDMEWLTLECSWLTLSSCRDSSSSQILYIKSVFLLPK